jgi:hypothetical protein
MTAIIRGLLAIALTMGLHYGLNWAFWISLVIALVVVYGGWFIFIDEGIDL